jgi:hypothetical protein
MVKCQCLVQIEAHYGTPTSVPRCLYRLSQDSEATSLCLEGLMCCFLSFSVMSFVLKRDVVVHGSRQRDLVLSYSANTDPNAGGIEGL